MLINSYAHRIDRAKSILGGLAAHGDKLTKWGITPEFITDMTTLYSQAGEVEQKRNAAKSNAQQLLAQQEQIMAELEGNCSMVKKLVRFQLPSEYWPEFGFRKGEYAAKETTAAPEPQQSNG
jgi:hypothetical protein